MPRNDVRYDTAPPHGFLIFFRRYINFCLMNGCGTVQSRDPRLEQPYESQIVPRCEWMMPKIQKR